MTDDALLVRLRVTGAFSQEVNAAREALGVSSATSPEVDILAMGGTWLADQPQ